MPKTKKIIPWLLLIIFIVTFLYKAFDQSLHVQQYTLTDDRLDLASSIRIIHLSDLHNTLHGPQQEALIHTLHQAKPDLILMTGDMFDDHKPDQGMALLLAYLKNGPPVYYVTGNHEIWSPRLEKQMHLLEENGIHCLHNQQSQITVKGVPCLISGIDDPDAYPLLTGQAATREALNRLDKKADMSSSYHILLAHRPEFIDLYQESKNTFNLVLSGHAHGGQVRLPGLINGLYAPNQGFFPSYAGGHYVFNSLDFIVSRGLSINPHLPRLFNPPEVVSIDLKGASK